MITVDPSAVPTLKPNEANDPKEPRKFVPVDYMSPWMFTPTYLEVDYATCSTVFLRSPLVQPYKMEIPSPFPPSWHQLVYEWYASIKRSQTKKPIEPPLVVGNRSLRLKPKFDSILRADIKKRAQEQREARKQAELDRIEWEKFEAAKAQQNQV
jgi:hypothetical protein